ncbi:MAG: hypothetical protein M3Y75_04085 [Actinomycetota bacterium]|nr:hypothetical protein [Actinomycetota bacterium]
MEALRMEDRVDRWNDDRLDELSRRMDQGFKELRGEMREGFARIDKRFERLYYVMITASVSLVASVVLSLSFG